MNPGAGPGPGGAPSAVAVVPSRLAPPARAVAYVRSRRKRFIALLVALAHLVGALTSVQAVMETRTSQGAIAWGFSLNTMPYLAVPAYWVFGRTKFNGYVKKRRADLEETSPVVRDFLARAYLDRLRAGGVHVRPFHSTQGRANRFQLNFLNAISTATNRFWIASPYFVPDEQIVSALKLAALRGVDVRVLVPDDCDNALVRLSGGSFVAPLEEAGVNIYRHTNGFLHHKIMLVDRDTAAVGTANFDNRSFRLNFEITLEVRDAEFARQVEALFERDFADSRRSSARELEARRLPVRLAVRVARLLAPVQ
ncbi:MAG: hypothetical protein HS113_17055 [Verrucomicrobiales bacterium]|nr:hypothetical protein [Verrucomicrobiales bacterium]